jgi:hypothetical protein
MKMRTFFIASLVAPALATASAAPQSLAKPATDPSAITFEHDGARVSGFALYVTSAEGLSTRIDIGMPRRDKSGKLIAQLPALSPGTYTVDVVAYNQAGESPRVQARPHLITVTGANVRSSEVPPQQQKAPASTRTDEPQPPKAKRGILSRVYRGIVGSDDESAPKK